MTMLVGQCKKCGSTIKLDIGDKTKEEVIGSFKKRKHEPFTCPGKHVELTGAYPNFWELDEWELEEGSAPTDEGFLTKLKEEYEEVYDTHEIAKRYEITSFCMGMCMARELGTGVEAMFDFKSSPGGKRYYFRVK